MEGAQAVVSVSLHEDKASSIVTSKERTSHEDDNYLSAGEEDEERSDAAVSLNEAAASVPKAENTAPPSEELVKPSKNESCFVDGASPEDVVIKQEESSLENRASPAVALMSSDDENKTASSISTAKETSSVSSNREFNSDPLVSASTPPPPQPQGLSTLVDSILMVAENGDPPGGGANQYEFSSLTISKSLSMSDARVANALAVGHTSQEGGAKDDKSEMKILALPSPDDDFAASPHHRRCVSVELIAKVPPNYSPSPKPDSSQRFNNVQIDTAAPIKSVKAAVSKFGGIVDWKAHRVHTVERRKYIEQELEKAQEELPACKQQCEAANGARIQVLKQLESTKRLIEELKLNLERAQTEEQQAKQDSELAKLRVEEMEQGIADEASFAAKAQLEVAKARHASAVSELKSVKDELEQLRTDYDLLIAEKEAAETKAEEAMFSSKEVDKSVQGLTIELITLKQALDSAHSAHLEAEEHRIGAAQAKEQDSLNWQVELKQVEEELEKINQQVITTKDLKSKLAEATTLLQDLKGELAAYMESKSDAETLEDPLKEPKIKTRADIETAINAAKRELLDVKNKIDNATKEVNILKVASASLKSQLEKENTELQVIQIREEMASMAAASFEEELNKIKSEITIILKEEQEEREKLVELPMQLQKAGLEVEQAKELTQIAGEDLEKAKHEANEAKAGMRERESKLRAVEKEIEAARASERLALAAITAFKDSESAQNNTNDDSAFGITISIEEYYALSKRAHEAEEQANARVAAAMSQLEIAKVAEKKSMEKLEEVSGEMSQRKEALEAALQKATQAAEKKLSVEKELRKWRADHAQKRKNADKGRSSKDDGKEGKNQRSPKSSKGAADDSKGGKKKKKSVFPRIFMFLGKSKKSHSSKPE